MKLNKLLMLTPIVMLALTSCGKPHRYDSEDYVLDYSDAANATDADVYREGDFYILQLSDIHLTYLADSDIHFRFIEKTIEATSKAIKKDHPNRDIDLIVITGDTFTFATKETIIETCNFFEKQGYPWTITFGNHDEQGYFSVDWMTGYLNDLSRKTNSNLLFRDLQDDDVFGSANFFIDLNDAQRKIIMMDSNRYNYGEGLGYDYIHSDQINWYQRMIQYTHKELGASLAFFHIPLPEYVDAYNKADADDFLKSPVYDGNGTRVDLVTRNICGEPPSVPLVNSGFFDAITSHETGLEDTKGIFVGHDHINSYCCQYQKDPLNDIVLCYGIKATNTVYYDDAYLGGQLITFHSLNDPNADAKDWFETSLILHKYADMGVK